MKQAVVLFNLGGPDSPAAVRPFLFNLFADPAIIRLPAVVRVPLAWWIARRREPEARAIYDGIGGASPLLSETERQARTLEAALAGRDETRVFVAMRYWHPLAAEAARRVAAFAPDQVVLLPLYPQFSTTTTASSLDSWREAAEAEGIVAETRTVCCYCDDPGLVAAHADLVRAALARIGAGARILFSAHGLPERVVAAGDPYQRQVERTVAAIVAELGEDVADHAICYQSRVGPLRWIGPSTIDEVGRAGRDGVAVVLVPVAFVSEHSETLVELDVTVRGQAEAAGVPRYERVPALGAHPLYVEALARIVREAQAGTAPAGGTGCAPSFAGCPLR